MSDDPSVLKTEAGEAIDRTKPRRRPRSKSSSPRPMPAPTKTTTSFCSPIADFDNYKKRIQRDIDSIVSSRRRMLLERFLPVLDNLERALQSNAGGRDAARRPRADAARVRSRAWRAKA